MDTNKTVLIVDDDVLVLESIDLLVSMAEGFQSIRALGSAGAASHLEHAHIDVIVADVILAGSMTGIDVCRKAIEHHPEVAIVVITADNEVNRSDLPERWVFLRKPFGGEQLLEAMDKAMAKARSEQPGA
ncbi:response regulator [Rhodanobacter ginsengisoli]|uniref:Response regulator n=1 Tax=Rhodanobacter ginsengisoli TaxID=418646 RepID=A0ABW0QLP3_9GAMM